MDATAIRDEAGPAGRPVDSTESARAVRRLWAASALMNLADGAALASGTPARTFGLTAPSWVAGIAMFLLTFALLPRVNNRTIARVRGEARG